MIRDMQPNLLAGTVAITSILCILALMAFDDRKLVWKDGGLFEMGQFVEVEPASALIHDSSTSAPSSQNGAP